MYCILCGTLLQADNQRGLVCRVCKQEREEKKTRETVIHVQYCYSCGYPYHPNDASIRHESCMEVPASNTLPLQKM
jgi:NMD protein affecting ribosome stability and mRNA decay